MSPRLRRLALAALFGACLTGLHAADSGRTTESFDGNWKFSLGDPAGAEAAAFADATWTRVTLPHDWSIAGPFSPDNPTEGAGAFLPAGIGWYRKAFTVPASWSGRQVSLEFDGVMAHSQVWINGVLLGNRPYGYVSFAYDITAQMKFGSQNVVAVRADNSAEPASRWYTGAGIYRHVRLVATAPVHVAHWGTFVTTPTATADHALVRVQVSVENQGAAPAGTLIDVTLQNDLGHASGTQTTPEIVLGAHSSQTVQVEIPVERPRLWDLDTPRLYQAQVRVRTGGKTVDATTTAFGIRDAHFEAATGFWLNGHNLKLKGVAIHADASALGVAVPRGAWEFKLRHLRELGANAIRAAHNPFDPDFLDLCDRMGFVVMDEMFDCWTVAKNPYDYHRDFEAWSLQDTRDTVLRDRNHPSIIFYSAGNEIHDTPKEEQSKKILAGLVATFHAADPSRPVTQALFRPNVSHDYQNGLADLLDVIGTNYRFNELIAAHVAKPTRMIVGTENGHEIRAWIAVRDDPAYSGEFIWTGIDYLGESPKWPQVSSNSGLIDRIGSIRPVGRQFESWWSDRPMVAVVRRIAPSSGTPTDPGFDAVKRRTVLFADWTPKNRSAHPETVEVYSNCQAVELFLNGRSLGTKTRAPHGPVLPESAWTTAKREDPSASDPDAPRQWLVPYEDGVLTAIASNGGTKRAESSLTTAGAPAQVLLRAEAAHLNPTWDGIGYVTALIADAHGVPVPGASNAVTFSVEGGSVVAVDSADNASHESFQATSRLAFNGECQAIVRPNAGPRSITVRASSPGLEGGSVILPVK